jgi:DNA-directed RNA polymerase subunit beta
LAVALCARLLPRRTIGVAVLARAAERSRRTFARLENASDLPNLIDIQRKSFEWLVDTEKGGLRETIDDVSPIEDYTGNLAVVFEEIHFDEPMAPISE